MWQRSWGQMTNHSLSLLSTESSINHAIVFLKLQNFDCFHVRGAYFLFFLPATHWAWALLLQPNTWTPPLNPSMEPDTACWDTSEIGPNQTRHQILHISCHTCMLHNRWSEYGTLWHGTKIIVKFLYVREIYGFYIFTIHYITLVLS